MTEPVKQHEPLCGVPMTHPGPAGLEYPGVLVSPCTLPRGHYVQVEDSPHYDVHGCHAPVLVHQSTLREVEKIGREWPDGIHTCAELQVLEPGRRPCTCGRCPAVR